ncbi:hypothetical protein [Pseudoduganella chitinolytica]|uniref:DUF1275 domain-containing protein n=1 Tax=Pseudoduganella chitinolytica TaxID=34070 RepID=A0ABY8BAM4_9BURK|nr:hypothetical protein [Pseudoduganella chitinolytica]WEF32178.1 hypothetical protein PX653_22580 [Pseudoduganella chitinolytica]
MTAMPTPYLRRLGALVLANLFGTGLAWALADDLVTWSAQRDVARVSLGAGAVLTMCQAVLCALAPARLIGALLFQAGAGLSLAWVMFNGILPLWWMEEVAEPVGTFALLALAVTSAGAAMRGAAGFRGRWRERGAQALAGYYEPAQGLLDWEMMQRQLAPPDDTSNAFLRERGKPALAVVVGAVLFMLLGPGLVFGASSAAAMAWAGAIGLGLAFSVDLAGTALAQAYTVRQLERRDGAVLSAFPPGKRRQRKRRR